MSRTMTVVVDFTDRPDLKFLAVKDITAANGWVCIKSGTESTTYPSWRVKRIWSILNEEED